LIDHPDKNEILVVRNGVDFDHFEPRSTPPEYQLVFTGNMGYPPNIRAALFLAKKVLPLVHRHIPEVKLLLSGAQPPTRVSMLQSPHVKVTGWIEDIRDAYANGSVFVAPMEIGTGLQNKLLEAMAMKLPCVTSALANRALGAQADTEVLIGTTPETYAEHIVHLLRDQNARETLAQAGHDFVKRNFNWQTNSKLLLQLIEKN